MNLHINARLAGLAAGMGLMGLVIALLTVKSQQQAEELRAQLNQIDSESFHIAEKFKDSLRDLNNPMYRYGNKHAPADRDSFIKASHELDLWIDQQKPKLTSGRERALMQQIDTAYDDYLLAAKELQLRLQSLAPKSATMDDYASLMKESQHLFDLGQALAKAHYESKVTVLSNANQLIAGEHALQLVSLSGLFLLGVVLAWVVYRDMIAPLRVKLVESQAMVERQEKLASLGMLAAGVAHEIRNPLTAIKAALFIQQKKFQSGSQELADARIVEREILRLERIVSDFLLFARPTEPELTETIASTLLQDVQTLLRPQLAREGIQLVLEESPPLQINVDAGQIKQVLINLVQNAADATGKDGVIKLHARRDRKRLSDTETNVVILEVADNGRGIPPEVEKRLFDPFFTTKDSGTGLGLSIAAGIIQKHGGTLQYQTQVDYGTTFGIILPQATA